MTRVYAPAVVLLCIAPLFYGDRSRIRDWIVASVFTAACTWNFSILVQEQSISQRAVRQTKAALKSLPFDTLPDDVLVRVWGGNFYIEHAYPVLDRDVRLRELRLMTLGLFFDTPTSLSQKEEEAGRGFIARLLGPDGVAILVSYERWRGFDQLETYCRERHGGRLATSFPYSSSPVFLVRARCVTEGPGSASESEVQPSDSRSLREHNDHARGL
jgi:hypothetical protein